MIMNLLRGCGFEHGGDDGRITRAAADVAGQHVANLLLVRRRHLAQGNAYRAQYSRSAEPALQGVMLGEGALHRVERARLGEPSTVTMSKPSACAAYWAAAHGAAIDQNRAGAAHAMLAADVNPEGLELMAQKVAQQHASLGLGDRRCPFRVNSTVNRSPAVR
jgi:hypothetical protein